MIRFFARKNQLNTCSYINNNYLSGVPPSTFDTLPSPDSTAIRVEPLNHLMECSSPQFSTSTGHVRLTDWPRITGLISSININKRTHKTVNIASFNASI